MSRRFLTWLEPQRLWSLDNLRVMGRARDCCSCQVRIYHHCSYQGHEEEDVAVFSFALELGEPADANTPGWRASSVLRSVGAAIDATTCHATADGREYKTTLPFAPPALPSETTRLRPES